VSQQKIEIDEELRLKGLRKIRDENFKVIHSILLKFCKPGSTLLEIGAAHGWFLDQAKASFQTTGIEPDKIFCEALKKTGHNVRIGFFPQVLNKADKYDIIVFNDVLEHIPDINSNLNNCYKRLNNNGILFINCPSSRGLFYKISKLLTLFGIQSFFNRMWQKGMKSPHIHYFNLLNLATALKSNGFITVDTGNLTTLSREGLFSRISYTGNSFFLINIVIYWCLMCLLPLLKIFPSDILYYVGKKADTGTRR
jgi:2-polyprenyl-3-methyl-5-hydroxy-6-metoxy-1,4-benzoquinol methylase